MTVRLYSFDIFDTLITRTTATPLGIFALMQEKLLNEPEYISLPGRIKSNFYLFRIQAEAVARNTYCTRHMRDITLEQIYHCLQVTGDLQDQEKELLLELEVQTEYENSVPIRENIEKLKRLLKEGKRVILVSNMYLSEQTIREMLVKADSVFENMTMYVSSQYGKTKGTYELYRYVSRQEGVAFDEWEHQGDHIDLDVAIPEKLGIWTKHLKMVSLLSWEKEFLLWQENNAAMQLLIGTARNVRRSRKEDYSYLAGSSYSAPLLLPYITWVLQESVKKGIDSLYFIARDGYLLKKMADILIEQYGYRLKTNYIYGSRKAWRLPSLSQENFNMEEFLKWNYPGQINTFERMADIFEITVEELAEFLPVIGKNIGKKISPAVADQLLDMLIDEKDRLISYICVKQRNNREAAIDYLRQEIDINDGRFAFVDLIGSGYTQKCLADLMAGFYEGEVETFFYRLDSCQTYIKNKNYAFFSNRLEMGNIIEVLCGAPHGQTLGYDCTDGCRVPVLGQDEGQLLPAYGFEEYVNGITDFTQGFAQWHKIKNYTLQDVSVILQYIAFVAGAKDMQLYDYIADMPYGINGKEKEVSSFAPRLTQRTLRQIYFMRKGEPIRNFYTGYSLQFSLCRMTDRQRRKVVFYQSFSETSIGKKIRSLVRKHDKRTGRICDSSWDFIASPIVLYGAGKRGQLLYRQITRNKKKGVQVVLWVDANYQEYVSKGLPVSPPEKIREVDYQQIVISVAKEEVMQGIKKILVDMGVPSNKILWMER